MSSSAAAMRSPSCQAVIWKWITSRFTVTVSTPSAARVPPSDCSGRAGSCELQARWVGGGGRATGRALGSAADGHALAATGVKTGPGC